MLANKPYIIGLTGGIGCGKSEAARFLKEQGCAHVDADGISRALTAPGGIALPAIRAQFGDGVFNEDGTLDRRALGRIVFDDVNCRHALEAIIHPMVQRRMLAANHEAAKAGEKIVFWSVPLLYETGMDAVCDETWVLTADHETQLKRLMARDSLDQASAEKRIASQMSGEERASRGNVVIRTSRPIEQTRQELTSLYRDLKKRV